MEFSFTTVLGKILGESGFAGLFGNGLDGWKSLAMILIAFVLLYMGIAKKFEPLLLVPIAFGMLLANLPNANIMQDGGLLNYFYYGVKFDIYPPLIFMGVGAMTDFGPLIARPSYLLLGAAAQFGIFSAFLGASADFPFSGQRCLLPSALSAVQTARPQSWLPLSWLRSSWPPSPIAAYSYMALDTDDSAADYEGVYAQERPQDQDDAAARSFQRLEKILFPIAVATIVILLLPDTAPLIGMLMLGNLFRECGVCDRLSDTVQNALMNSITILLGTSVGATAAASTFLTWQTIFIIVLGLVAFLLSTFGGVIFGDIMCWVTKGKINPLIGSAGVSAVPMAARVAQIEGQKENPSNFLLMHAMGPNVAGVIGSAAAAGFFLKLVPMLLG